MQVIVLPRRATISPQSVHTDASQRRYAAAVTIQPPTRSSPPPPSSPFVRLTWLYAAWIITVVVAAGLGRLPVRMILRHVPYGDKVGHFLLIGVLAYLINRSVGERGSTRRLCLANGLLFGVVVGEECLQRWMRYRAFEWADLMADAAGMLCFGALAHWQMRRGRAPAPSTGDGMG